MWWLKSTQTLTMAPVRELQQIKPITSELSSRSAHAPLGGITVKDAFAESSGASQLLRPHQHINNVANLGCRYVLQQLLKFASDNIKTLWSRHLITVTLWEQATFEDKAYSLQNWRKKKLIKKCIVSCNLFPGGFSTEKTDQRKQKKTAAKGGCKLKVVIFTTLPSGNYVRWEEEWAIKGWWLRIFQYSAGETSHQSSL